MFTFRFSGRNGVEWDSPGGCVPWSVIFGWDSFHGHGHYISQWVRRQSNRCGYINDWHKVEGKRRKVQMQLDQEFVTDSADNRTSFLIITWVYTGKKDGVWEGGYKFLQLFIRGAQKRERAIRDMRTIYCICVTVKNQRGYNAWGRKIENKCWWVEWIGLWVVCALDWVTLDGKKVCRETVM